MTREELRKKRQEIAKSKGYREWQPSAKNNIETRNIPKTTLKERVDARVSDIMSSSGQYSNSIISAKSNVNTCLKERVEARAISLMNRNNQLANSGNIMLNFGKTRKNDYSDYRSEKRITGKDLGLFTKNLALGGYKGGVSAVGQSEYLSQEKHDTYRKFNQIQTKVNEEMKNKTADDKLKYNIEQLDKSKSMNGVLVQEQMKINDTSTMKMYNAEEKRINKKILENAEKADTRVGKYLVGDIAPSMGQSLVGTGLDILAPGMGSAYRMLSYSGNYTQDGLNKGMHEKNAAMYGLTMAGVETAMDTIGDKLKGLAIGEAKTANGLKEIVKIAAKELGINSFFEGTGEAFTEPLQELVTSLYGGTADYENILDRMGQAFLAGAVSELLMTGSSLGYGSSINAMNKIKNGEQVSVKEISSALKEINQKEEVDIKNILKNNLNFAEQSLIQSKLEKEQVIPQELNQVQNANMEQTETTKNSVDNGTDLMYNNLESGSDINGQGRKQNDNKRTNDEVWSRQTKEGSENTREYTREEYNKWEQNLKLISKEQFTESERQTIEKSKAEYDKDIRIYDENENDNTYSGGASINSKGQINISRQEAEATGLDYMIAHENVESDFMYNDIANDILDSAIDIIMKDENFQSQVIEFWKDQKGNIPTDRLIAKDILCDRFAERKSQKNNKYKNVLNDATRNTIDMALDNYYKQVYGKDLQAFEELEQSSSFSFDNNVMTSAYGRNNYEEFMRKNIDNGNLLYDIDEGIIKELPASTRLQLSEGLSSSVDTVDNVSTTNNIIPQNENNMQVQSDVAKQKNEKYNKFKQQLTENGLNYEDKRVNAMFDLPNKRGIDVEVNTEVFKKADGSIDSNINAMYVTDAEGNRKIIYNPKANLDTVIEKNTIHEITHDLEGTKEYKQLSEMVLKKIENTSEFQEAYDSLKEAYSKVTDNEGRTLYNKDSAEYDNMIKQEAVADYLGENLGNQEYINELVNGKESRNIAQKIYDVIVSFLDKVTGYKSEEAYLRGLKNKFEKAFNAEYINKGDSSKYSIHTNKDGGKFVKVDVDQNIFEGKSVKEQTRIAQDYILSNFRENGLLKEAEKVNVSRKTANEYTHPKSSLDSETYSSKMRASTELDNLLEISKYITSEEDDGRHIFAKDGWDYYETVFKVGDKTYSGWLNIANGKNGKLLYDITNIKERASNYSVKTVSVANSSINSITNSKENVNTTKYSMQESENNTSKWQEFLDKNSLNNGTKTTLGELRLPELKDAVEYRTKKNMEKYPQAMRMPIDEILKYKTRGGYRTENQINNLIEDIKEKGIKNPIEIIRNEDGTIEINNGNHRLEIAEKLGLKDVPVVYKDYADVDNIDESMYDVSEKQLIKRMEAYNDRNNRNSGKTNINNGRMWTEQENSIGNRNKLKNGEATVGDDRISGGIQEHNDRSSSITTFTQNIKEGLDQSSSFNMEENKPTRHDVIQKNREIARDNIKNISKWKDKSNGAKYQLETMERNMYDIIPDKQEAKKIIDTYFTPVHESEAEKQRFINKYNDEIRELDLNKYEAEATQFLGELKYNPDFKITPELKNVLDRVNDNIQKGKVDKEKVAKSIDTFRNIYDELFEIENTTLREQGYKEKPYRRGYFPHFIDYVEETRTEKVLAKLGFKIDKRSLPTDIAGITEQFVPGKTWNRSALQRKTNKTDFNALKGFDTYIAQAADNIFHTENIQRLRGLENEIRYQYSEKGIQADIDNILKNESLNAEEKQAVIDQKFEQVANPMPNLVVELRRYTNALANKKSSTDRDPEDFYGRPFYSTVNAIENRFAGNAVGLNIGSALTNFIPITQAYSQVGSIKMGRAMLDTVKSYIKDDGFVDKSAFLTSRLNSSDKLYKTTLEQVSEKANIAFDVVDSVASNIVVRGKYLENISNGMSEIEAIKNADSFARSVMADRSKGALPTKFEEKNPLTKAFTQFQLEVNNQYRYMFKDIPRDLAEKGLASIALAYFKMFVAAYLFDKGEEEITGRKSAFSPIDLIKSSYDTIQNEELSTYNKITSIATEAGEQLSFVGGLLGGGRVPVSGALPSIPNIAKAGVGWASGEMNTKKALSTLGKEVTKPAYYLLPPFGGGQLKKTVEGIKAVIDGGSYGIDKDGNKNLQFPVEDKSATSYIKAGLFGKYALPKAKSYVEDGFKSLNAEQTEVYEKTKIDFDKLKEYFAYSKADNVKKNDKMEHISNMNTSVDNQWELYKYNVFSSSERDNGTSQVTDAEYAIKNKMATKKEYMKLYKDAEKNKVEFPNDEKLEELKNSNLNLSTYMKYQTEVKKATNEKKRSMLPVSDDSKVLSDKDKIRIIQSSTYKEEERRTIYANYIGKDDDTYNTLSKLQDGETNIDAYLDYKLQKFTGDEDTSSNIVGKNVSGSSKNKTMEYLRKSSLTDIEKIYIVGTKYANELNESQKEYIFNLVNKKITDEKELNKVLKKFEDLDQHKNGEWHWKEYK